MVRSGVEVVVAKCVSNSAKISMSNDCSGANSCDNTLIRLYENERVFNDLE